MEDKGFPKYQWSVFVKNGRDAQFVVRENDFIEFKKGIVDVLALVDAANNAKEATTQQIVTNTPDMPRACPKCGNKVEHAMTKNGKPFVRCSTNRWNPQLKKAEGCDFVEWSS